MDKGRRRSRLGPASEVELADMLPQAKGTVRTTGRHDLSK